jgi:hypothetical protein
MGDSDEYPGWALPLIYRRMLWQQYGVVMPDFDFQELLNAIRLYGLENERRNNQISKLEK